MEEEGLEADARGKVESAGVGRGGGCVRGASGAEGTGKAGGAGSRDWELKRRMSLMGRFFMTQ